MVVLRLKKTIPIILLYVMTMLTKFFCVLAVTFSVLGGSKKLILKIHLTIKGTGVDFNFWVFFISILVMTMLTKLFCVLAVTFFCTRWVKEIDLKDTTHDKGKKPPHKKLFKKNTK